MPDHRDALILSVASLASYKTLRPMSKTMHVDVDG